MVGFYRDKSHHGPATHTRTRRTSAGLMPADTSSDSNSRHRPRRRRAAWLYGRPTRISLGGLQHRPRDPAGDLEQRKLSSDLCCKLTFYGSFSVLHGTAFNFSYKETPFAYTVIKFDLYCLYFEISGYLLVTGDSFSNPYQLVGNNLIRD